MSYPGIPRTNYSVSYAYQGPSGEGRIASGNYRTHKQELDRAHYLAGTGKTVYLKTVTTLETEIVIERGEH